MGVVHLAQRVGFVVFAVVVVTSGGGPGRRRRGIGVAAIAVHLERNGSLRPNITQVPCQGSVAVVRRIGGKGKRATNGIQQIDRARRPGDVGVVVQCIQHHFHVVQIPEPSNFDFELLGTAGIHEGLAPGIHGHLAARHRKIGANIVTLRTRAIGSVGSGNRQRGLVDVIALLVIHRVRIFNGKRRLGIGRRSPRALQTVENQGKRIPASCIFRGVDENARHFGNPQTLSLRNRAVHRDTVPTRRRARIEGPGRFETDGIANIVVGHDGRGTGGDIRPIHVRNEDLHRIARLGDPGDGV